MRYEVIRFLLFHLLLSLGNIILCKIYDYRLTNKSFEPRALPHNKYIQMDGMITIDWARAGAGVDLGMSWLDGWIDHRP